MTSTCLQVIIPAAQARMLRVFGIEMKEMERATGGKRAGGWVGGQTSPACLSIKRHHH